MISNAGMSNALRNIVCDALQFTSLPARHSPLPGNYPFVFDDLYFKRSRKDPPRNESAPNLSESYDKVCTIMYMFAY